MSKIICEVCGTSYPETSSQCPICGCVNSGEMRIVRNELSGDEAAGTAAYAHVKGGRFSKANVKKRNRSVPQSSAQTVPVVEDEARSAGRAERALTITVIVLLLAIVAVVLYIVFRFFDLGLPKNTEPSTTPSTSQSTVQTTVPTTTQATQPDNTTQTQEIPCKSLHMDSTAIYLPKIGAATLLNVYTDPFDTTEEITYSSSDEAVATVTSSGKVVAVGFGKAVITITCGSAQITCDVECAIVETTEPPTQPTTAPTTAPTTQPTTPPTTKPKDDFELNRSDFTLSQKGETWTLYNGSIPKTAITWSSDDESVATVSGGKVTAVGAGYTTIRAEYNGQKRSCIVRCNFADETTAPTEGTSTGNGGAAQESYTLSHTDVTIKVGETFNLILKDSNGNAVSVNWRTSNSNCSVSGNTVTGVSRGDSKVYAPYNGTEYACVVRVKG